MTLSKNVFGSVSTIGFKEVFVVEQFLQEVEPVEIKRLMLIHNNITKLQLEKYSSLEEFVCIDNPIT